jgi:hypothetical protein
MVQRALARVAYDGSWFSNAVESLTFDNPLRVTDDPAAPAQGRMALWPDSTAHTVSAAGSVAFPGRSRAFAYVSLGNWLQDQALLPHTINSRSPSCLTRPPPKRGRRSCLLCRGLRRARRRTWLNGQFRSTTTTTGRPCFR